MQKKLFYLFILMLLPSLVLSQDKLKKANKYFKQKGEVAFTFKANNLKEVRELSQIVSIDHDNPDKQSLTVNAIANKKEFKRFLEYNLDYTIDDVKNKPVKVKMHPKMTNKGKGKRLLNTNTLNFPLTAYPTFADYDAQMNDFATNNPSIAQKVVIGQSTNGKDLMFIKLSDNINTREAEPRLLYTSTMHGDETAGYPMMISLIYFLTETYKDVNHPRHAEIKNLIDNSEIWINPLANPDGTFNGDPSYENISNAKRGNANNIDLNRNYPSSNNPNPDGQARQAETTAFMNMADNYHFVSALNFHGGAEVFSYPWDEWVSNQGVHTDDDWYRFTGQEYAGNAQANSPSTYFDGFNNGITHGADWYVVTGGRQDYMNYYKQCREVTIELSNTKLIPANQIQNHWNYNRDALIDFLKRGTHGFKGIVKDQTTGNPIQAKITVIGRDDQPLSRNSWVETELPLGDFYRPIKGGTYSILIEATCYAPVTLTGQTISDGQTIDLGDILLTPTQAATPSGVSASNITSTSATITWSNNNSSSYDYRYRQVGATNWTEGNVTTTSVNLNGLSASTNYEIQVRSRLECGSTSVSDYSSVFVFTTAAVSYCNSQGNNINDEFIGNVTLNTINKNSTTTDNNGYSDYTSISTDLTQGNSYTISITPTWTGTLYNEGYSVWIDYNKDGDFTDAGEQVFSKSPSQTSPVSGAFTIPTNVTGSTRMRVSLKYAGIPTSCETFSYGEVEDYTVNIVPNITTWYADADNDGYGDVNTTQQSQTQPTGYVINSDDCNDNDNAINPAATEIVGNNIDEDCTGLDKIVWYADTDGDGFGDNNVTQEAESQPQGYVSDNSDCNDSDNTIYPNAPELCDGKDNDCDNEIDEDINVQATVPTGLSASNITNTSATVSWSNENAISYDYKYRQVGTTTWTDVNTTATSVNLTGLLVNTGYEFQVRSNKDCATPPTSNYSSLYTFSTTDIVLNYCNSQGNNINDEYIGNVTLNTINNSSTTDGDGYSDYTSISTDLAQGQSYTISITPTWTGTIYSEGYSVWIDYNKDGDFTDAGEQVYSRTRTTTSPVSGAFTIPTNVTGSTRMRVSMKYNAVPSSCETFTYGEVEDYTVNIVPSASFVKLQAKNTASNFGTVKLYPNPFSKDFDIQFNSAYANKTVQISVHDVTGKQLLNINKTTTSSSRISVTELSRLNSNTIYMLYITDSATGEKQSFRVIKD